MLEYDLMRISRSGNQDVRVVHVAPVHDDVHVHVPGAVQAPLLAQAGEHTATKQSSLICSNMKKGPTCSTSRPSICRWTTTSVGS